MKEVTAVPRKPKQPCAYPGCPRLSDGRYCEEHSKVVARQYEKYSRDPETKKKYGRAWKRIRDSYVKTHPFCERCYEQGILTPWMRCITFCLCLVEERTIGATS